MIHQHQHQPGDWQRELALAIRDGGELLQRLGLSAAMSPGQHRAAASFPVLVPPPLFKRIVPGDRQDPILRQLMPLDEEMEPRAGYRDDPLQEHRFTPTPGLLHKYRGRALLILTGGCAVNCRYCFRRHFPYAEHRMNPERLERALHYIAADTSIEEVILSGGDPLLLEDTRLGQLLDALDQIEHVQMLRVHSRMPIVLPSRVTTNLCRILQQSRLRVALVLHCNCAAELDAQVLSGLQALQRAGLTLLNQSVLLRGVNDNLATLRALSLQLYQYGVLPYYLFLLDPVQGAAHFDVPEPRARELYRALRASLPGYLVPRLAREVPGDPAKRIISG